MGNEDIVEVLYQILDELKRANDMKAKDQEQSNEADEFMRVIKGHVERQAQAQEETKIAVKAYNEEQRQHIAGWQTALDDVRRRVSVLENWSATPHAWPEPEKGA